MKRLFGLLAFIGLAVGAQGQGPSNPTIIVVGTAPSGACANWMPYQSIQSTNVLYGCFSGTWGAFPTSASGTGTVTSVSGDGVVTNGTITTSGSLGLVNAAQNSVLAGPATGGAGAPSYQTAPTFSGANLTSLPAAAAGSLTGTTLASNVVTSSLTSAAGGSFGTAAFVATGTSGATIPLLNGINNYSGTSTFSATATATTSNTLFSGTLATPGTTVPSFVYIAPGSPTAPSYPAAGSILGINSPSGFTGHEFDIWNNGALLVSVTQGGQLTVNGAVSYTSLQSASNCASAASPAVCATAPNGHVVVAAGVATVVVNTTKVTANSEINLTFDSSLGALLGVTCNTTITQPSVSARTAGTSFTITLLAQPITNPACIGYTITN